MIIKRAMTAHLESLAQQFPVIAVFGPRQSGKTTLTKETFPRYLYVTMEDIDLRMIAKNDPRGFLASYSKCEGVIIDEIQEVPELLSYMQGIVDQRYRPGFFIITGSQNFLMQEKITQTLAGRIALLTLLPLSVNELLQAKCNILDLNEQLIKGFYPRLYVQPIKVQTWFANYIATYVERDVRQILNISDTLTFQRFLKLCAARIGNILNYAEIARDCGIAVQTAKSWISILESSYIIKLVSPFYKNFNKRLIKSPKIYFYDTALVCSLLGIKEASDLSINPIRGALFESFVMSELFKYFYNHNEQPQIFFWRDVQGHEVDVVIEKSFEKIIPVEIKSGMTIHGDFFKGLIDWAKITETAGEASYIVYGGNDRLEYKKSHIIPWNLIDAMLDEVYR